MTTLTEYIVEQAALAWLESLGRRMAQALVIEEVGNHELA